MLKKALVYLLFATLALVLTAAVAVFLILKLALAPGRDEWPARFQAGPVAVDVGVPTAIRLATSSWFAPWLAGRTLDTAHGPVRFGWNAASETLELDCAPCSATVPALGKAPIRLDSLRATVRRDAGMLSGTLEAAPPARPLAVDGRTDDGILRGRWTGRLTQQALHIDIQVPETPIARWYTVLAPDLAELQRARIGGTLALGAQVGLPAGTFAVQPRIADFTVDGLGTETLANARTTCGAPSRLGTDSWLARAVIAAEDQRFFTHPGYDMTELAASLEVNQKASKAERGGSTLSQQLAKILVTGGEQSADRKLRELLYAVEMEQTLGKARILQLYLDNAPWGARICGADAAARTYFKRPARNLEPVQAVWLAAMLNNPALAVRKWQQEGNINLDRAKWVADGVRGISKAQRDALLRSVATARFAPP
ncbi:biosynthetic peptidoglycan transglycosylase [Variovorax sp. J31P207]|uniref:biosynthetic peptidoglycan transglycosylase n=1 Tax=Variovorax sp. J31P207 TaxID=3053510 RepID=UPI002577364C|nr:biosynthetic peptidoglycan transglycosylase [Variovorax sp. J31P207]MDM0065520.1 biosynthetic peptidoglycan transglycosylase [Variovorax sp. J31P207]